MEQAQSPIYSQGAQPRQYPVFQGTANQFDRREDSVQLLQDSSDDFDTNPLQTRRIYCCRSRVVIAALVFGLAVAILGALALIGKQYPLSGLGVLNETFTKYGTYSLLGVGLGIVLLTALAKCCHLRHERRHYSHAWITSSSNADNRPHTRYTRIPTSDDDNQEEVIFTSDMTGRGTQRGNFPIGSHQHRGNPPPYHPRTGGTTATALSGGFSSDNVEILPED